jgi:hypothetical protein
MSSRCSSCISRVVPFCSRLGSFPSCTTLASSWSWPGGKGRVLLLWCNTHAHKPNLAFGPKLVETLNLRVTQVYPQGG